uniref:ArnT family glycosyltransferase n=1 Tax=Orrella sp. TaxID=1921583 RepID=UPI0040471BED
MQRSLSFVLLLGIVLVTQLLAMAFFPLTDTSEPRYAAIARLMSETGDWITPWFSPGVPFWGKPPLSFWAQALSFDLFGITEFAVRLPSWLATVACLFLVYQVSQTLYGRIVAERATLIYASSALVFMMGAAVLTDPFFALGTTLCMVGPIMASRGAAWWWRYSFFIGLAIGLLAKGPLVFVLVAGVFPLLYVLYPASRALVKSLPWVTGIILMVVLSLPWFILAELKTPGFIDYFIVGEHFKRFIQPGWGGDLYGTAHRETYGMIWLFWVQAALPWGVLALILLVAAVLKRTGRQAIGLAARDAYVAYFSIWATLTPAFFTFSGNILWTYLLPALPAFSVLLARATPFFGWSWLGSEQRLGPMMGLVLLAPVVIGAAVVAGHVNPLLLKTEKGLVQFFQTQVNGNAELYYLYTLPFSARFYSGESAQAISPSELQQRVLQGETLQVAVPRGDPLPAQLKGQNLFENRRYEFFLFKPL